MAEYFKTLAHVSDDHESAFRSDFALLDNAKEPQSSPPRRKCWATLLLVTTVTASIAAIIIVGVSFWVRSKQISASSLSAKCVHALGGGRVGLGGDFPYIHSAECQQQLREYSRPGGEYWQEVALAAASAIDTFKSTPELQNGDPTQVVVFDIDETALSNIAAMFEDDAVYESYKQQASAPALGPVLAFYKHLYASNYSVAFITGRDENARDATAANLLSAGYGSECGTGPSGEVVRSIDGPCYMHLYLRQLNDTRLASVYKPAQRHDLLSKGYSLVGSIGDQFSDLSGGHSADTGFKLPNPFYYIL